MMSNSIAQRMVGSVQFILFGGRKLGSRLAIKYGHGTH
jgi:hypothetical protein